VTAERPIFVATESEENLVDERFVAFTWAPGFAVSQKQRSIRSLHEHAQEVLGPLRILEISSKSPERLGVQLSAFSLPVELPDSRKVPVECAFQGSKVVASGGPFLDLLDVDPRDAKRDERIRSGGPVIGFRFFEESWPSTPPTAFYDWLYVSAVEQSRLGEQLSQRFDAFTDIEFNPQRSLNCQARAAAMYVSLVRRRAVKDAIRSKESFLSFYGGQLQL
jgi:hypothetical protein